MYKGGGYLCEKEEQGKVPAWRDWVFMESKRRFVVGSIIIARTLSPADRYTFFTESLRLYSC